MPRHRTDVDGLRRAARPRTTALAVTLIGLVVLVTGCGSGQLGRRHLQRIGSGSEGQVGSMLVRDATFAYDHPIEGNAVYQPGESVAVRATIVNEGSTTDRLVSVSSPIADEGLVRGEHTIPGGHTLTAGYTEPVASITLPNTTSIDLRLLGLNTALRSGPTYPVVFTFARAGEIRIELRVDNPDVPGEYCPLPPNGKAPKVLTAPPGRGPIPPRNPLPDCAAIPTSIPTVQLLDVEGPLLRPTWATEHDVLLGFIEKDGRRLVRVDPETGETLRARELENAGEDFGLIPQPDERVALPLTEPGRVALLDTESLVEVGGIDAVPAPSRVTVDELSKTLFVLSEDGSTVTGVDYERQEVLFRQEVQAGPEAVVAPGNDTEPSFWLVTPEGFTYFHGEQPEPMGTLRVPLSHKTFSSDDTVPKSAYFAEEGSSRVQLVEGDSRGGLEVVESNDFGETIEHVEAEPEEEHRVYAVTATKLISMRYDSLEVITTTEYRSTLERAGLGHARISDLTVGDDYLYLAVEGEPYVLKIRKEESLTE
ncbi:copper chaperone PCu(A)C [Haloactinomyces albus]|uniref:Copper(I)-binding protein n=1 Tax=Haloactinomyces albus TaxID=1352928 RepID=A0AAE3ZCY8_9ACTN|nr:copper chaperone PCu(A)C [Haloactinomyces albus]MDR7301441.1 copper(I)-binding protein [Haloactinomyces albus]